jgi:hypothetical protein
MLICERAAPAQSIKRITAIVEIFAFITNGLLLIAAFFIFSSVLVSFDMSKLYIKNLGKGKPNILIRTNGEP